MIGSGGSLDQIAAEMLAPFEAPENMPPLPPVETWNPPDCGEIDMRIARDGTWYYQGTPILRPRLVRLFSTILRKDGDRYFLVTPVERVAIGVEDAPFLAVEMAMTGRGAEQVLWFRTNVGDRVRVDAAHPLRFETDATGGIRPYVLVRGALWALVARALVMDLVAHGTIRVHEGGPWLGILSSGVFFPIAPAEEQARADEGSRGNS